MIKKLEKDEAATRRDEEDGRPFAETRPGKGRSSHVYRVRGAPCSEWLDLAQVLSTGRSIDAEHAVRDARLEVRMQQQAQQQQPVLQMLSWEPPPTRDREWNVICLRLG
jgi:hypothetical protein